MIHLLLCLFSLFGNYNIVVSWGVCCWYLLCCNYWYCCLWKVLLLISAMLWLLVLLSLEGVVVDVCYVVTIGIVVSRRCCCWCLLCCNYWYCCLWMVLLLMSARLWLDVNLIVCYDCLLIATCLNITNYFLV